MNIDKQHLCFEVERGLTKSIVSPQNLHRRKQRKRLWRLLPKAKFGRNVQSEVHRVRAERVVGLRRRSYATHEWTDQDLKWRHLRLTPPVQSHSRRASLEALAPTAPCLVYFASQKQHSVVFMLAHPKQVPCFARKIPWFNNCHSSKNKRDCNLQSLYGRNVSKEKTVDNCFFKAKSTECEQNES